MKYITEIFEIPHFNEVLITTIKCHNCDYRHNDVLISSENTAAVHEFVISGIEDLDVRVIKSSSATIKIPELGIKIEPVSSGESLISNIEGIIKRIENVVEQAGRFNGNSGKNNLVREFLDSLDLVKNGKLTVTVVISDPLGNSAIISNKVKKHNLPPDSTGEIEAY